MAEGSTRFEYLEKSIEDYIIEQQNKNTGTKTKRAHSPKETCVTEYHGRLKQ